VGTLNSLDILYGTVTMSCYRINHAIASMCSRPTYMQILSTTKSTERVKEIFKRWLVKHFVAFPRLHIAQLQKHK